MTWMSLRRWRWKHHALLALAAALGLVGCTHLDPGPVSFPTPPPLECPEPGKVCLAGTEGESSFTPPAAELASSEATEPIDLPTALRLANVQNPDVALARE